MTDHDCQCSVCEKAREDERAELRRDVLDGLERAADRADADHDHEGSSALRLHRVYLKLKWGMK